MIQTSIMIMKWMIIQRMKSKNKNSSENENENEKLFREQKLSPFFEQFFRQNSVQNGLKMGELYWFEILKFSSKFQKQIGLSNKNRALGGPPFGPPFQFLKSIASQLSLEKKIIAK